MPQAQQFSTNPETHQIQTESLYASQEGCLFTNCPLSKVKVRAFLWPTVSRPVCPGVRPQSGPVTNFSFSLKFSVDSRGFVILWCPFWQEDGSIIYCCCLASPAQSLDHILGTLLRLPNLEGQVPVFISPSDYTSGHWVPILSPLTTRRATLEVFYPVSTWRWIAVEVEVNLWPMVSCPVCLGVGPLSGTSLHDAPCTTPTPSFSCQTHYLIYPPTAKHCDSALCPKSKLLYDWWSVSLSWTLGTHDQILLPVERLLSESCSLVSVGCPVWREDGLAVCSPSRAEPVTILNVSSETPPTWRARIPYLYPTGTRWPSYNPCRSTVEVF
jgi:hypothetical protein